MDIGVPAILDWADIENSASDMFNVWAGRPELRWARNAWGLLDLVNCTRYSNPVELAMVKIRLMALAAFYRDFCHLAWKETNYPLYVRWSELLTLEPIRIGLLLPRTDEWSQLDDHLLLCDGLTHLAEAERPTIAQVLTSGYGLSALVCALWNSNREPIPENPAEIDDLIQYEETPEQILNFRVDDLGPAYGWLDQGADPILECGG